MADGTNLFLRKTAGEAPIAAVQRIAFVLDVGCFLV